MRQFEAMPVFIDFLTEHPTAKEGTAMVDGVPAGVVPGIGRALATAHKIPIEGRDCLGCSNECRCPCPAADRCWCSSWTPKDACDVLLLVSSAESPPPITGQAVTGPASAWAGAHSFSTCWRSCSGEMNLP